MSLSYQRYGALMPDRLINYDPGNLLLWILGAIRNERDYLTIRTQDAFLVANTGGYFWMPHEPECYVLLLCAKAGHHWEAVSLLRHSQAWARSKNCVRWLFNSETGTDFEALARRVGAEPYSMRFCRDLTKHG